MKKKLKILIPSSIVLASILLIIFSLGIINLEKPKVQKPKVDITPEGVVLKKLPDFCKNLLKISSKDVKVVKDNLVISKDGGEQNQSAEFSVEVDYGINLNAAALCKEDWNFIRVTYLVDGTFCHIAIHHINKGIFLDGDVSHLSTNVTLPYPDEDEDGNEEYYCDREWLWTYFCNNQPANGVKTTDFTVHIIAMQEDSVADAEDISVSFNYECIE